jgi:uncharacterized membrane protein
MTNDQNSPATIPQAGPDSDVDARKLPETIPPELDTALRTAGINTQDPNVSKAIEISLLLFSGSLPLPPPQVLAEYNDAYPGLVEKIIHWTEQQRQHRMSLEQTRTQRTEARLDRGQWIAGSVALGGLLLASVVGIFGNPWVAGVIAIVAVGGPTAAVAIARQSTPQSKPSNPPDLNSLRLAERARQERR